jgi:hypothetical protein
VAHLIAAAMSPSMSPPNNLLAALMAAIDTGVYHEICANSIKIARK